MTRDWRNVRGWLSGLEGLALQEMAAGRTVLEIGSYCGRSTVAMAEVARLVVSLDWHQGDPGAGWGDTLPELWQNLADFGLRGKVVVIAASVDVVAPLLTPWQYDLVFVDGAHDAASVERDCRLARKVVRPGGTIAMHDWNLEGVRTGAQAAGVMARPVAGLVARWDVPLD